MGKKKNQKWPEKQEREYLVLVLKLIAYPGTPRGSQDYAGRTANGWYEGMPADITFTLNRWGWALDQEKAKKCDYVMFSYEGVVKCVAKLADIDGPHMSICTDGKERNRYAVRGDMACEGDPVFDKFMNKLAPTADGTRNRLYATVRC